MSEALDNLALAEAAVAEQVAAASTEITTLKAQVADLQAKLAAPPPAPDESGVVAVTDKLRADADALKAAVAPSA